MDLIDRYVTEVGKHLPRKNRLDIEAELRSTLEDMLEDRGQQTGRPADEALAAELLEEYGSPKKVAATYQTHPYLIGPRMFPFYTFVLKIVLFAVTLSLSIATIVSLIGANMAGPEMLQSLVDFTARLVSALMAAFGNVTLVFAILERFVPVAEFEEKEKWTTAELTKEPDPAQVKTGDMIASIVFTVAALIIFNLYPQIVGIWNFENEEWVQIAGLSEAFFRYLPWINLSAALTIALDIWLLQKGIWNTLTRWLHIGLQVVGIAIAAAMLRGPSLLVLYSGTNAAELRTLLTGTFERLVPVILLIVIVASVIEIVKDARNLLSSGKVAYPIDRGS
ncbi:MAG: hypothetical protein PVJ21_19550 [Anaerolineales bacterium]|jgi:hypothetical protein